MDIRQIGSSGLSTPRLVLGGNVFGWTSKGDEAFAVLDRFTAAGGTLIDSADVYSAFAPGNQGGESESLLGEWLKRRGRRDDVLIATKVGMLPMREPPNLTRGRITQAVEASLRRLQSDYIDLYYAHQPDPDTPISETLAVFDTLIREGKVRAIGASNYDAGQLREALDTAARESLAPYTVLQPEYNLIRRANFEGPLQDLCVERGIGVLPYFGLASGFLTGKYRSADDAQGSDRAYRIKDWITPDNLAVLETMDQVAAETGATLPQIALAWLAAQPGVTAPIASARNVGQLEDLLPALELELSAEQLDRLSGAQGTGRA